MPDVEENYIGMWDITDVAINKSYSAQKEEKRKAAKKLKRQEREQKKFNKVMKIKRKEAGNLGVIFDVETAKKEASREMSGAGRSESEEYEKEGENGDQAKNISYIPESKSEPDGEDNELHPLIENLSYDPESNDKEVRPKKSKKRKHSETKDDGTETTSKKSKKSRNTTANKMLKVDVAMIPTTTVDNAVKKQKQKSKPIKKRLVKAGIDLVTLDQVEGPEKEENLKGQKLANKDVDEVEGRDVAKKSKRLAKIKDEIEREEKRIKNEAEIDVEKAAKKARKAEKKARKEAEAAEAAKAENDTEKAAKKAVQKEKKSKKEKSPPSLKRISTEPTSSNPTPRASAEQWNPDALTGDAARKNKFLRLLGAGKTNISSTAGMKKGNGNKTLDVEKVQSELERQYEMGMKMKHDGGGKRRGLGA
ncbi:small acidic protein family-domain-containing protein [Tricladium varicosporioides]|nr:small acidic protein family-domain-containing protein [Hymenoscyphus varicosporioides]